MATRLQDACESLRRLAASASLPVWAARYTSILLPQGLLAFLLHAWLGFEANHADFPVGIKLDAVHAVTHILWGAAGAYYGFVRPNLAVPYLIVFGVYYVALSAFGTFTDYHFGLQLGLRENIAHWTLGPLGLLIGLYGLWQERRQSGTLS